jgi:hypothetical protein
VADETGEIGVEKNLIMEKIYRTICHFIMALASTSLLPAIYFIKSGVEIFQTRCKIANTAFDIVLILGVPVMLSVLSLLWMKYQSKDSIKNGVNEITPVNHEYLPVYLGYIFVSLSMPNTQNGGVQWQTLIIVYFLICLFVTCSKTLCFNPIFIVLGYGYYQVTTSNGIKVFVMTRKTIRKGGEKPTFPHLRKVNELVYVDTDK